MRSIYIVRHTEAEHHVQELGGGWYDTSLTEKGKAQAKIIAKSLFKEIKSQGIPIYSSDLKRCSETAIIFSKIIKSKDTLDKNLREMNFGEYAGKTKEWRNANIIPIPDDGNRLDHRLFRGAESRREAGERATKFIHTILKKPDENVIIITHGFFSTFLIMAWLKVPIKNMDYGRFYLDSGGVDLLSEDELFQNRNVIYLNRLDFLKD
jgi:probable phosphoglycerate mutase